MYIKKGKSIYLINAMIDSGCSDYLFINKIIVREICEALNISSMRLIKPKTIKGYDDQSRNAVTHILFFHLTIQDHTENLTFMMIAHLSQQDLILNKPWLKKHAIDYHELNDIIFFRSSHCTHYDVAGYPFFQKKIVTQFVVSFVAFISVIQSTPILKRSESQSWLFELKKIETQSSIVMQKGKVYKEKLIKKERMINKSWKKNEKVIDIVMIETTSFDLLSRNKEVEIFVISLKNVDYELKKKFKTIINSKNVVFQKYHDFLNVFSKEIIDILFSYRKHDHKIELLKNKKTFIHALLYRMSEVELQIVKNYFEKHLNKNFIIINSASFASSILFAKKSSDELRFCVDFRKLNDVTKKNRYSLPLIIDLMIRLSKAKFLIKIDIRHAFNRIRLASEIEEDLIIFRTRFESYKYLIMSFGLINEPAIFQTFINDILMKYLNEFVIAYLDDILIYSDNMKDHRFHVRKVLQKLREAGIQADIDKCEFHVTETKFLGVIVGQNGLQMDPKKVLAVEEWEARIAINRRAY